MEGLSSSGGHRNVDGIQPLAASPTFLTKRPPESQLQVRQEMWGEGMPRGGKLPNTCRNLLLQG